MQHPPPGTGVTLTLQGHELSFETGRIARQASGAVLARRDDDVVLATVVVGPPREGIDFFPLVVEYREKLAAAGRIPGSFNRREGRITDHEVLVSRIIDRTVRSLFPDGYRAEVQIQATVMSSAPGSDVQTLALLAACCALRIAGEPVGTAAGLRICAGRDGSWVALPTAQQRADADLDFVVSAGPDGLVMVEGEAREVDESQALAALAEAQEWIDRCRSAFDDLRTKAEAAGHAREQQAVDAPTPPPALPEAITVRIREAARIAHKQDRRAALRAIDEEHLGTVDEAERPQHEKALAAARHAITRDLILCGTRPDGRAADAIRPIGTEVGLLPRAHGSALFTRGETQAIVTCTLGSTTDAQRLEGLDGSTQQRFLLHYNFPPYSVGEARPLRGPGRREIGHGTLARRGLTAVLPDMEHYPYTVRVESEISESNGSSSMATVCGGSLAMMHAGVPLRRPVAGIAMGLVTDGERTAILSDILGDEDHLGDMDFKVVGTAEGITALQLDNKVGGLASETLAEALDQARRGRLEILEAMARTLAAPNRDVSPHAPQVLETAILPSSIGQLVGPKGANIRSIQEDTGARVSIADDGRVTVYASERTAAQKALARVFDAAGVLRVGTVYPGVVTGVKDFGVFVRINAINEGLVPREELGGRKGQRPDEIVSSGDEVEVEVLGADDRGRLRLSRRRALK